jgi:KDO2-lipid IV(A) lauroyltransferase
MGQRIGIIKRGRLWIEYVAAKTLLVVCSFVPLRVLRPFGAALGWIAYRVIRIRRRVSAKNIMTSLPGVDQTTVDRIALESYKNFGRSVMESIAYRRMSPESMKNMFTVEGREYPEEALARGNGALVCTGHFGNWELLASAIALSGFPIHGTDTRHTNRRTHQMIVDLRTAHGAKTLAPDEPVKRLLHLLSENQFLGYLPDQDGGRAGVFVDFLGRLASTRRGPAILAVRKGAPIAPVFAVRERTNRHRVIFCELIWPDPRLKGRAAVEDLTQRFTRLLEDRVREHPELYFWMHRRWKTRPVERDA